MMDKEKFLMIGGSRDGEWLYFDYDRHPREYVKVEERRPENMRLPPFEISPSIEALTITTEDYQLKQLREKDREYFLYISTKLRKSFLQTLIDGYRKP